MKSGRTDCLQRTFFDFSSFLCSIIKIGLIAAVCICKLQPYLYLHKYLEMTRSFLGGIFMFFTQKSYSYNINMVSNLEIPPIHVQNRESSDMIRKKVYSFQILCTGYPIRIGDILKSYIVSTLM